MTGTYVFSAVRAIFRPAHYRWWHGAGIVLASNLAFGVLGRRQRDRTYYEQLRQTPFAPPSGAFVPVWAVNNASVAWGNLRLLNRPPASPHRRTLILLQGVSWLLFATFGFVFFRRGSVILGFVWTIGHWALTIASVALTARRDRPIALSLATTLVWLTLATATAAYQATHNPDALFGTPPLLP